MEKEIIVSAAEFGIEEVKAKQIQAIFAPMLQKMTDLEIEYNEIITKEHTAENCALAGDLRKKYVKVRTSTAALHKEQKAFYLAGGRFCDALKNAQAFASQGNELKLGEFEKHFAIQEQNRIAELCEVRKVELEAFGVEYIPENIGEFDEVTYSNFKLGAETAFNNAKEEEEKRIAEEAKAQAEEKARIEAEEKAKEQERKRVEAENAKLKADAEKERKAREKEQAEAQAKIKAQEEENARIKAEADAKLEAERLERERIQKEEQKKLDAERKAREELEQKEQARKDAEAKKLKEEEEAKRALELAPDKEKLAELIANINAIKVPELATDDAKAISDGVTNLLGKVTAYIADRAKAL